jgi:hypothetical protein
MVSNLKEVEIFKMISKDAETHNISRDLAMTK